MLPRGGPAGPLLLPLLVLLGVSALHQAWGFMPLAPGAATTGIRSRNAASSPSSASAVAAAAAATAPLAALRSSSRLYARVSQKTGKEQNQEQDGNEGLPKVLGEGEEVPQLTRQQEEAIDASMGVIPPEQEELTGEAWTAEVERRLQQMYEKGTYDPTPINLSPQELARQQWVDEFLNKEERPIRWDLDYWFGTWTRGDIKFSSPGRGIKSFGFALAGIGLVTLMYLLEDELINPLFEDYQKWDGNDIFHVGEDLGGWVVSIPGRVQNYVTHFNWLEWSSRVAARAGAAPRWYQQIIGLPGDNQLGGPGP